MRNDDLPQSIRDVLYAQKHHLLDDDVGKSANLIFESGVADGFVNDLIGERVRKHKIHQAFSGPFPLPPRHDGDFIQGINMQGSPIAIPIQWLNAHSLTLGNSGSGKTTKALFHALQIILRGVAAWLFDCRKAEFVKLRPYLQRSGKDLIVLPVRRMKFNPLQVPFAVDPADWIPRVADLLVLILELPPRASKALQSVLHRLFDRMKIFDGATLYPTLFDLFQEVQSDRQLNPQSRQALCDSLHAVIVSLGPEVLAYRRGWDVHELSKLSINFVLGGVSDAAQNLILSTLLMSEFMSRVARGMSNGPLQLYIAVDEGQRIVSTSSRHRNSLVELWPLVRGTGIALDISVPTTHGLLPEALSLSATKYLGRAGSSSDVDLIGRSMGLSREQLIWTFHETRPGRFIAQVGESYRRSRHPYVIDIPPMRLVPPEEQTTANLDPLRALPVLPAHKGAV